jgi:hypothetical protein
MADPKKDACEPTDNKLAPSKQSKEYVMDLREILEKLRKLFN